ncbi:MAG: hypothetical protein HC822_05025 [Oscillochloris sp.]|nr:hypothetical protein [Oscillochloris sp.]
MSRFSLPPWFAVLLCFLVLGVVLTWPLVWRPLSDLPGGAHKDGLEDAYQNVWNLWWTVEALRQPTSLWLSDRFFYPEQPNLLYHTLSPANTLLVAPITALWGPIAGYNAVALLSFGFGGLGMWLLARRWVGPAAALLAGIVYVASPFHLAALVTDGQLQIFAHQWLPWYGLFLLRMLHPDARLPDAALAGAFLVLTAYSDWYYTLFLLLFSAPLVLWTFVRRQSERRQLLVRLALLGALFSALAGPLIGLMLLESARSDYMYMLPDDDPARLSADLLAYLVPPRLHALWGVAPWDWGVAIAVNRRFYLGLVAGVLACVALIRRPILRPWGWAVLAFCILSLGGSLRINGVDTGIVLPQALLADLPIVRLTRQPDRFNVMVTLALGVLAAGGAEVLAASLRRPLWRGVVISLAGLLLLLDYFPAPIVTRTPAVPPFLASLPPGDGALIEYPFHGERPYRDAERMLFQTVHGRPISGGYHSRAYPQPQLGLPVLRDLEVGRLERDITVDSGSWPQMLATLGFEYIIGYKQQPLGPQSLQPEEAAPFRALVEAGLGVKQPLYEDAWLIAYRVPPADPAPLIGLRGGWGALEAVQSADSFRWIGARAEIGVHVPDAGRYQFSFDALPAGGPRHLLVELPTGTTTLPLTSEQRRYRLLLDLPAGTSLIGLASREAPTSGDALEGNDDTRPITVRFTRIALERLALMSEMPQARP